MHGARKLDVPTTIQIDEEVFALVELHRQPGDTDEEALIRALQATVLGNS